MLIGLRRSRTSSCTLQTASRLPFFSTSALHALLSSVRGARLPLSASVAIGCASNFGDSATCCFVHAATRTQAPSMMTLDFIASDPNPAGRPAGLASSEVADGRLLLQATIRLFHRLDPR